MNRVFLLVVPILLAVLFASGALSVDAGRAPVIKYQDDEFGAILATPKKQALYYWKIEQRAGGKIRCKGSCATAWPPLIVRRRSAVPRRIAGIPGRFGVIRRPAGRLQGTHLGLAVYTYAHVQPEQ